MCSLDFQILWQAAESRKQAAMAEEQLKEAAQRLAEFETEMLGIIHVETWIIYKRTFPKNILDIWTFIYIYIYILGIYPWNISLVCIYIYIYTYIYIYRNHEIWISSMRPGQALL